MSQSVLRPAFQAAYRPNHPNPTAFFHQCRAKQSRPLHMQSLHRTPSHTVRIRDEAVLAHRSAQRIDAQVRRFSRSLPARATVTRMNARQDDEGNDMTIEISERAAKQLRKITSTPPKPNTLTKSSSRLPDSHLRITVTSGGCHGFQYLMSLEPETEIDKEEDTIFEWPAETTEGPGRAEVVLDSASLELLKGSTVDYTQELIGSQFKIVGNPRAKSSCGCGTSFDID